MKFTYSDGDASVLTSCSLSNPYVTKKTYILNKIDHADLIRSK